MTIFDQMIHTIGTREFSKHLFLLLNETLGIRHVIVDAFDIHMRPVSLFRYSSNGPNELASIRRAYVDSQFYAIDPIVQQVRDLERTTSPGASLSIHVMINESVNSRVHDQIMMKFEIRQRLAYIFRFRQRWFTLKMLKMAPSDVVDKQKLLSILDEYPSLLHVIGWHSLVFTGTQSLRYRESYYRYETLLQSFANTLSTREIEVCARALAGSKNTLIAEDLGIAPATVRTLRNRAFQKMDIHNIQELSTMCLNMIDAQV